MNYLDRIVENNRRVDAGEICGLCGRLALAQYTRIFHALSGKVLSHCYCSEECKAESYEFQSEEQDIIEWIAEYSCYVCGISVEYIRYVELNGNQYIYCADCIEDLLDSTKE